MSSIFNDIKERKMITKEQITDWFCERNQIRKEELDKYHRYAIATTLKYAQEQVKNIAYEPVLAVVHRKNEYGEICYCKDNEINCDLCRFSGIPMQGNSVCEKCYDRLKSNEYYR